jgi:hypothetical protein
MQTRLQEGATIIGAGILMNTKKSPARSQQAEESTDSAKPRRSATELYVAELSERTRPYAKPIAAARRIVDEATPSLTDALYDLRREGRE